MLTPHETGRLFFQSDDWQPAQKEPWSSHQREAKLSAIMVGWNKSQNAWKLLEKVLNQLNLTEQVKEIFSTTFLLLATFSVPRETAISASLRCSRSTAGCSFDLQRCSCVLLHVQADALKGLQASLSLVVDPLKWLAPAQGLPFSCRCLLCCANLSHLSLFLLLYLAYLWTSALNGPLSFHLPPFSTFGLKTF